MAELVVVLIVATSIWVAFDAPGHGISAWWAVACLALWIVAFPWYLVARSRQPVQVRATSPRAATGGRWEPDPRDPEKMERWREGTRWTRAIRKRDDA